MSRTTYGARTTYNSRASSFRERRRGRVKRCRSPRAAGNGIQCNCESAGVDAARVVPCAYVHVHATSQANASLVQQVFYPLGCPGSKSQEMSRRRRAPQINVLWPFQEAGLSPRNSGLPRSGATGPRHTSRGRILSVTPVDLGL